MPRKPQMVHVVWEDALVKDSGPWCYSKKHTYKPKILEQVGFLLSDTPAGIILSQAWATDMVGARDQIPRGMIRKITPLVPKASK